MEVSSAGMDFRVLADFQVFGWELVLYSLIGLVGTSLLPRTERVYGGWGVSWRSFTLHVCRATPLTLKEKDGFLDHADEESCHAETQADSTATGDIRGETVARRQCLSGAEQHSPDVCHSGFPGYCSQSWDWYH